MLRSRRGAPRISRNAFAIVAIAMLALLLNSFDVEARGRNRADEDSDSDTGWREGFASIVVDAKTGKILQETKADLPRHPASLTKIMTLYLLFEQIEAGRIKLDQKITISERAADQAPTKLDLDAGEKIEVEDAIKALITRSANDVACAIAEAVAGDEDTFALVMTRKARALGMKDTVFKNASGLPDKEQVTTARDLALLGRAIQDRFPRLYRFFSMKTFLWRGTQIANHNRLINRAGVDGIKTGYTRASGFNLVTSVKLNNRAIVAVVLGGASAGARDERMRDLIDDYLPKAYAGERTLPLVAEAPPTPPARSTTTRIASAPLPPPVPGSREPIRPNAVRTVAIAKGGEPQPLPEAKPGTLGVLKISSFANAGMAPLQPLQISSYAAGRDRRFAGQPHARHGERTTATGDDTARGDHGPSPAPIRAASGTANRIAFRDRFAGAYRPQGPVPAFPASFRPGVDGRLDRTCLAAQQRGRVAPGLAHTNRRLHR